MTVTNGASSLRFRTISFLSDYGLKDEFVGVVKSVIRSLTPEVAVIDITHDIEAHDVRAGGLTLARSVQYLAPGVVLAVVDPGVGGDRKPVAIEVADGQAYLIGPDNGLLAPAVSMVGGATGAVVLDNPDYHLATGATTFDGRDIFAPVAAHLCAGVPFDDLGSAINPSLLMPGILPVSQADENGGITAEVLWVDRFGNLQLNVDPDDLDDWGPVIEISGGRMTRTAQRVRSFSELPTGGLGLIVDSYGLAAIVADRMSAAFDLELGEGDGVTLRPAPGGEGSAPVRVQLGSTRTHAKPSFEQPENPREEHR